jgi:hypothetical protein
MAPDDRTFRIATDVAWAADRWLVHRLVRAIDEAEGLLHASFTSAPVGGFAASVNEMRGQLSVDSS